MASDKFEECRQQTANFVLLAPRLLPGLPLFWPCFVPESRVLGFHNRNIAKIVINCSVGWSRTTLRPSDLGF